MSLRSLQQVSYSHFRSTVREKAGHKVRNKGCATYLYDQHNRLLAMLTSASLDAFGRVKPAQYYIRAA